METNSASPEDRWETILSLWKQHQWLYVIAGFILGLLFFPFVQLVITDSVTLLGNLVPEAISTLAAVFVIDRIYRWNANHERLQELITQMRSKDNGLALAAVDILRLKGWLSDESLRKAPLSGANLGGAHLVGADLMEAHLDNANLRAAHLVNANLQGTWLYRASIVGARLQNAKLMKAVLRDATMTEADILGANLSMADLGGVNFTKADLRRADLSGARMIGSNLENADVHSASMSGAVLGFANLSGAKMLDADLVGARLGRAKFDEKTILPDGSRWNPSVDMNRFTNPTDPNFWRSDNPNSPAYRGDS